MVAYSARMSVDPIPSPCVRSCCLGLDDICIGCGRALDEITGWQAASEAEKQRIVQRARQRLRTQYPTRHPQQVPE
jgi:predicted Fe-S protein YdhL (DUF1289 family)